MTQTTCPQCGAPASGRFCSNCSAPLAGATCGACGASITAGAKFCHVCGKPAYGASTAMATRRPWPWIMAAMIAVIAIAVLGYTLGRSARGSSAGAATGQTAAQGGFGRATTDLSTMSPREQADRLFDRVMIAHEQGDTQQVTFFAPMAIQAYDLIGGLDADARYHIGLIHSILGQADDALAQADSLEAAVPGHLMAAMLRNSIAAGAGDTAAIHRSYRAFLDSYEAEIAARRPEYEAHPTAITNFRAAAERDVAATGN